MIKRNPIKTLLVLAVLIAAGFVAAPYLNLTALLPAATVTEYRYESEMGEHIGGGDNKQYTPADAAFSLTGDSTALELSVKTQAGYWSVALKAAKGEKLHLGHYDKIEPQVNRTDKLPVLWVVSNGNQCNEASGSFTIQQLVTDEAGKVAVLAADFAQSCESPTAPQLRGYIKYNVAAVTGN